MTKITLRVNGDPLSTYKVRSKISKHNLQTKTIAEHFLCRNTSISVKTRKSNLDFCLSFCVGGVLPLCNDAVSVICSSDRLGHVRIFSGFFVIHIFYYQRPFKSLYLFYYLHFYSYFYDVSVVYASTFVRLLIYLTGGCWYIWILMNCWHH